MSSCTVKNVSSQDIVLPSALISCPGYMIPWPNLAGLVPMVIVHPGDCVSVDTAQWHLWTNGNPVICGVNNGAGLQVV